MRSCNHSTKCSRAPERCPRADEFAMKARSLTPPFAPRLLAVNWPWLIAAFLLAFTVLVIVVNIVVWAGQRFEPPPVSFIRSQTVFWAEMFYAIAYAAM